MTAHDWRSPPPVRPCLSCRASEGACGGKQMLSGRHCCVDCDHDDEVTQ